VNLFDLVTRERARRLAPIGEARVIVCRWTEEQAAVDIEVAKAAGRIGPGTEVIVIG
jgi:16S rRNA G1207 methylase RsmC